jgi:voltage-gated potassium channel
MYLVERHIDGSSITSIGMALYWGIAAFSTAGIADTPISGLAQLIGGVWIILGSALFFGTIVATITTYFFRPLHRPAKQIIDTIEYNLEQMDDLTIAELELLKKTTDALIVHMEQIKAAQQKVGD